MPRKKWPNNKDKIDPNKKRRNRKRGFVNVAIENSYGYKAFSRGIESEKLVCNILDRLKQEGSIRDYIQSKHNSLEDSMGIDITVYDNYLNIIYLQVKSSDRAVRSFESSKENETIICLNGRDHPLKLKQLLLSILNPKE